MKTVILSWGRRILTSLILSVALLAISNFQTIAKEPLNSEIVHSTKISEPSVSHGLVAHVTAANSEVQKLREVLMEDELVSGNPFANLSSSEPLNGIYARGVFNFDRQTFRSSNYIDESGYDVIRYDIEHSDHTHSFILAYVESDRGLAHIGEAGAARVPVVLILSSGPAEWQNYTFRNGLLREHSTLKGDEAQALLDAKLASSVPFLSVSR